MPDHSPIRARSIPADHVANALSANPDGWGIMFAQGGRIVTSRGLRAKSLRKAIARIGDTPCTIHFRYATHGTIDTDNCHPFEICGRFAVMHNGIIDTVPIIDKARSDTWHWANHVLAPPGGRSVLVRSPDLRRRRDHARTGME